MGLFISEHWSVSMSILYWESLSWQFLQYGFMLRTSASEQKAQPLLLEGIVSRVLASLFKRSSGTRGLHSKSWTPGVVVLRHFLNI